MSRTLLPGKPYPLGATSYKRGTNFALYSDRATRVDVCFFDADGNQVDCITLREKTAHVWHGFVNGIRPGQLYGYRVDGPWDPHQGLRFNFNKLLVDPYAKSIAGNVDWKQPIFGYDLASGDINKRSEEDSAAGVPKSVVIDSSFDWSGDCRPDIPLADSVIYEVNVRGYSASGIRWCLSTLRGTYAGLAREPSIDYFKKLGVTAVELLPVHHFIDEGHLVDRGLRDYWGYNTLGYFAPMSRYSSSGDQRRTGARVQGDGQGVARGGHRGHSRCGVQPHLRGQPPAAPCSAGRASATPPITAWSPTIPQFYMDYTGTGNTLNVRNPQVLKMIMDSLRYWVTEMHVDGFRFDLAATLARELHDVSQLSVVLRHHPPGPDAGRREADRRAVGRGRRRLPGGPVPRSVGGVERQISRHRAPLLEGRRRPCSPISPTASPAPAIFTSSMAASPYASINFITAHDGFTLCDLVSYNEKHNEANGDNNSDGSDNNDSWNMGAEGPTDDPADQRAARAPDAQLPRHADALAGRAHARRRR